MRNYIVSLNNIGVALMRRHRFAEAKATFEAALQLMQASSVDQNHAGYDLNPNMLLTQANQYLALTPRTLSNFAVNVLDHDSPLQAKTTTTTTRAMVYPFAIDDLEASFYLASTTAKFEMESASLLYNYGLSLFCLSIVEDMHQTFYVDEKSISGYMESSEDMLHMALGIIENHEEASQNFHSHWYGKLYLSILEALEVVILQRRAFGHYPAITKCNRNIDKEDDNKSLQDGLAWDQGMLLYLVAKREDITTMLRKELALSPLHCARAA